MRTTIDKNVTGKLQITLRQMDSGRLELLQYGTLTFSGGFIGAFSYAMCDNIFVNAQTGNLINLMLALKSENPIVVGLHLLPFVIYILGISCTVLLPLYFQRHQIPWKNICLLLEATSMGIVCIMPKGIEPLIYLTPLFFVSALQYNTFTCCNGVAVSTVFCTNNIRQMTISFWKYRLAKDVKELAKMKVYTLVLVAFLLGALLCFMVVKRMEQFTVLIPCGILLGNGLLREKRLDTSQDCVKS